MAPMCYLASFPRQTLHIFGGMLSFPTVNVQGLCYRYLERKGRRLNERSKGRQKVLGRVLSGVYG